MIPVLRILVLTLPLCAFQCKGPQVETVVATVFGEEAARNSVPFTVATFEEVALEEVPPVYERHCWIEWHRAGTMAVEVCEDRPVLP
jgi:hypothetical protein